MSRWALRILVFFLALGAGLAYVRLSKGRINYAPVQQPVQYSHYVHTHEKQKLACKACHRGVEESYHATLPSVQICAACHLEPRGNSEEERRFIREYVEPERPIPWKRLYALPDHAFFSHRLHVVRAGISCTTCHGPMDLQRRPPPRPLKVLTMEDCIRCHQKNNVDTDCNRCHR